MARPENTDKLFDFIRTRPKDRSLTTLIVDSPWLPGYAGANTLDFFFDPQAWLSIYRKVHADLPTAVFVPDLWVEFAMATEPSGYGIRIEWSDKLPPGVYHYAGDVDKLIAEDLPNPEKDGLMPVVLRQYERMMPILREEGLSPAIAAARGPLAVASHLTGVSELLMLTQLNPDQSNKLMDRTTDLCINWLQAQLDRMDNPEGILVLDDLVGMLGPEDLEKFGLPRLQRIRDAFPDKVFFFHNDTPNEKVFPGLATVGIDVFNFSHKTPIDRARELVGPEMILMGNIPPLDVLVRGTPGQSTAATEEILDRLDTVGPVLMSPGGGVSPDTPIENLRAVAAAVDKFNAH